MKNGNYSRKSKTKSIMWWEPPPPDHSIAVDFCRDSSLHGLKYISQPRRHLGERIFWMIAFVTSVAVAVYFILLLWQKYQQSPIIVSFQPTETYIEQIPFPAVTICNVNNAKRKTAEEFIQRVKTLIDENGFDEDAFADLYYLDHICETNSFTKSFNFKQERSVDKELIDEVVRNLNTSTLKDMVEFFGKVSQSCEEMVLLCYWGDEIQNCSHLFFPTETNYGYCCTFNMVPTSLLLRLRNNSEDNEDVYREWSHLNLSAENIILSSSDIDIPTRSSKERQKLPRRQLRSGKSSGLTVLLDSDSDDYFCTNTDSSGFQLEAHFPLSFPKPAENGIAVAPSSEVYMNLKPDLNLADEDILNFPLKKRQCYFGKEMTLKYYKFYTPSNCVDECIANITFMKCQCVRYYMPRGYTRQLCGPKKFNCTEGVRKSVLHDGVRRKCPKCLPLCTEVLYTIDVTTIPLRTDVKLWQQQDGESPPWADHNLTILHVYFGSDSTYPRVRNQLYGATDLLSNTGGILGLCLGFSGLSLLEVLYFLTLRAWCQSRGGRRISEQISHAANKIWQRVSSSKSIENGIEDRRINRRIPNSYAADEFKTWVAGPTTTKNVDLSYEISPFYRANRWNAITHISTVHTQ